MIPFLSDVKNMTAALPIPNRSQSLLPGDPQLTIPIATQGSKEVPVRRKENPPPKKASKKSKVPPPTNDDDDDSDDDSENDPNYVPDEEQEAAEQQQEMLDRQEMEQRVDRVHYIPTYLPEEGKRKFEEWNEETDAYKPVTYNPYVNHNWGKEYNPKTDYKYDRRKADMDIERLLRQGGMTDGRIHKEENLRSLTENQKADLNQLIDITVNKKRDLKFNPNLLSLEYADKYAKNRGGWAQALDVTPYDNRNEDEIVVFNKYGIPTHINGYSWGQSDAGVQQLYQEQYPGGYDTDKKKFVPFNKWKKQQFDYTERKYPWEPIRVKSANTKLLEQLKGRGYNPPKPPAEALPVTSIWNKIVSKRLRLFIDEQIEKNTDINVTKSSSSEQIQQYNNHWIYTIIKDCVSLIQLSSLFFKYYMDSRFWQLIKDSGRISEDKMEKYTWKDYKKLISSDDGVVNRAQYRRLFYELFVDPPKSFWWSKEVSERAVTLALISINGDTLYNEVAQYLGSEEETTGGYIDAERRIRILKQKQDLNQEDRFNLADAKQEKAYYRNIIKTHFSDAIKAWSQNIENTIIHDNRGEWDPKSINDFREFAGSLDVLDEPLPNPEGTTKWDIQLPDPKTGETKTFNMAEIPEKGKGKK